MKTTVLVREDLYEILKKRYGPRGISEAINAILAEALLTGEGMFGTMAKVSLKDLRDRRDRPLDTSRTPMRGSNTSWEPKRVEKPE